MSQHLPRLSQALTSVFAAKNINTVSPFLTLANLYDADRQSRTSWRPYLDVWGEWLIHGLPKTEEGGFQVRYRGELMLRLLFC